MRHRIVALWIVLVATAALTSVARAVEVERVPAERVCMAQDRLFPEAQTPIEVQGKTYYGCCPMCAGQLGEQASLRHARDPVSGRTVDKASALTAATRDGTVLYFESEVTLERYRRTP
jgi:YHS domain-containing protein